MTLEACVYKTIQTLFSTAFALPGHFCNQRTVSSPVDMLQNATPVPVSNIIKDLKQRVMVLTCHAKVNGNNQFWS